MQILAHCEYFSCAQALGWRQPETPLHLAEDCPFVCTAPYELHKIGYSGRHSTPVQTCVEEKVQIFMCVTVLQALSASLVLAMPPCPEGTYLGLPGFVWVTLGCLVQNLGKTRGCCAELSPMTILPSESVVLQTALSPRVRF